MNLRQQQQRGVRSQRRTSYRRQRQPLPAAARSPHTLASPDSPYVVQVYGSGPDRRGLSSAHRRQGYNLKKRRAVAGVANSTTSCRF